MTRIVSNLRSLIAKSFTLSQATKNFLTGNDISESTSQLVEPYKQSTWVMSAIKNVVGPLKNLPITFYSGDQELVDGAVLDWWSNPAVNLTQSQFVETTGSWYKLAGESFWLLDDSWSDPRAMKAKMIVARPPDMRHVIQQGKLVGWVWTDDGGAQHTLLPEQVIHLKQWNPYNRWRGLGEMEAAWIATQTDYAGGTFIRDTFRNAGDSGAYVTSKGQVPSEAQQQQIVAALRDKRAARMRGDYRPVFLAGDLAIADPKIDSPDEAFVRNRILSRHEIFIAFGVPASMSDVIASYSIGSASDMFRLITNTCQPLSNAISETIDRVLVLQYGTSPVLNAEFNWDEHPTMQSVRRERVDAAVKLFAMGMPLAKCSEYLDMELPEFDGWEMGYVPTNVIATTATPLVDMTDNTQADPPADPTSLGIAVDDMVQLLKKKLEATVSISRQAETMTQRAARWRSMMTQRNAAEKAYLAKLNRLLHEARSETLALMAEHANQFASAKATGSASNIVFKFDPFTKKLTDITRKANAANLAAAAKELNDELLSDDLIPAAESPWKVPPPAAVSFLKTRENFMTDIADSIHKEIMDVVTEGMISGLSEQEVADLVRAKFNNISAARAQNIARTETAIAYNTARDLGMKELGIAYKEWLATADERCRATHLAADGQRVALDKPFSVGDSLMMFPTDDSLGAGPEEICNCRCVQIAVDGP